jgi:thioredoxin 1
MSSTVIPLSTDTFRTEVLDSEQPALVDFTAKWCPPCRAIAPKMEALARAYQGRLKVGMIDVDQHPELADRYGVRSIPTLLLFRRGQVVQQLVGSGSGARIEEAIRKVL